MTASNSPPLTVEDQYLAGQGFADRALEDPGLSSKEAIIHAQNQQGDFARGFNDRLGGAAAAALARMRASGAAL